MAKRATRSVAANIAERACNGSTLRSSALDMVSQSIGPDNLQINNSKKPVRATDGPVMGTDGPVGGAEGLVGATDGFLILRTPRPATGVPRALRARSVPGSVPENGGCPTECPTGCLRGPSGPGLRSVRWQMVSRECPRSVRDTFLTLRGHSRDTFGHSRAQAPGDTPSGTPSDTPPVFGDTPRDTLGPKGPRDSCSWRGSSQF